MANAVLPLGKGVRAAVTRMSQSGAVDAFAIQGMCHVLSQYILSLELKKANYSHDCSGVCGRRLAAAGTRHTLLAFIHHPALTPQQLLTSVQARRKPKIAKGARDIMPEQMIIRQKGASCFI